MRLLLGSAADPAGGAFSALPYLPPSWIWIHGLVRDWKGTEREKGERRGRERG